jgi:hypothetical protein
MKKTLFFVMISVCFASFPVFSEGEGIDLAGNEGIEFLPCGNTALEVRQYNEYKREIMNQPAKDNNDDNSTKKIAPGRGPIK